MLICHLNFSYRADDFLDFMTFSTTARNRTDFTRNLKGLRNNLSNHRQLNFLPKAPTSAFWSCFHTPIFISTDVATVFARAESCKVAGSRATSHALFLFLSTQQADSKPDTIKEFFLSCSGSLWECASSLGFISDFVGS